MQCWRFLLYVQVLAVTACPHHRGVSFTLLHLPQRQTIAACSLRLGLFGGREKLKKPFYPFHLWQLSPASICSVLGQERFFHPFPKGTDFCFVLVWDPGPISCSSLGGRWLLLLPFSQKPHLSPSSCGNEGRVSNLQRQKNFFSTLSPEALGMTGFVAQPPVIRCSVHMRCVWGRHRILCLFPSSNHLSGSVTAEGRLGSLCSSVLPSFSCEHLVEICGKGLASGNSPCVWSSRYSKLIC